MHDEAPKPSPEPGRYPEFDRLLEIMQRLRAPGGCPWDRKQTHRSLIKYLREESFEVIEAILEDDADGLCEELGDLVLQVVFHALIASERGVFGIRDVLNTINRKLENRHPHVFDAAHVQRESLDDQWERIKNAEKKREPATGRFDGLSRKMDPWTAAERIQLIAAGEGFDWEHPKDIVNKIREECGELEAAFDGRERGAVREETADLLFSVLNLSRSLKFDPAGLMEEANRKFIRRYEKMTALARRDKPDCRFKKLSLDEKEALWRRAKRDGEPSPSRP